MGLWLLQPPACKWTPGSLLLPLLLMVMICMDERWMVWAVPGLSLIRTDCELFPKALHTDVMIFWVRGCLEATAMSDWDKCHLTWSPPCDRPAVFWCGCALWSSFNVEILMHALYSHSLQVRNSSSYALRKPFSCFIFCKIPEEAAFSNSQQGASTLVSAKI